MTTNEAYDERTAGRGTRGGGHEPARLAGATEEEAYGRLVNVVDVEATCWSGQAPPGQVSEIIEIGLCVVDTVARERVARHRLLVRPARSTVSAFCTELTGLTQAEVERGMPFADACATLAREHRAATRAWVSWGDYDRKQFARQCERGPARYPFSGRHTNAKAVFADAYGLARRPGMARALQLAGLPLEGRHHRGEDDAWNIGALVLDLLARDAWPGGDAPGAPA
ncbi:exonuclease domain-containing protein [Streptomyces sp. AC536]|nr:exonuclease domain-containing protein [Streptomyces buecherae]QNJ40536.1 exonuclease domain-containing protein [Streptomyces buecherae]